MPTTKQELASLVLGRDVLDWMREREAAGASLRGIAFDLSDITGGKVRVSPETIRNWLRP